MLTNDPILIDLCNQKPAVKRHYMTCSCDERPAAYTALQKIQKEIDDRINSLLA